MIRWHIDLAIADPTPTNDAYRVVGSVYQLAVEGDSARHGQVRQVGRWVAVGCARGWMDSAIGSEFLTRLEAMAAVAQWWQQRTAAA